MTRIIYVISTFRKSGPTNQLYYMVKYLDRDLFEPHLITLSPEPENSMIKKFQAFACPLYSLNYSRFKGLLYAKGKLKGLFDKIKPDIIHSQGIRGDSLCHSIVAHDKHVLSIRNFPSEDYVTKFGFLKGHLMAFNHFRVIKRSLHATTCSKMLSAKFMEKKNIKLGFIQNGVDTDAFKPLDNHTEKLSLKRKYKINPKDILLITIGSLIPRKNLTTIIKAFKRTQNNALKLIILGQGSEEKILKTMAKGDDRIRFPGYSNEVVEYLQMSDYYISSSLSEGLPNSVLEAMACGLPVILSGISSHRELFENSKCPVFFQPNDHMTLHKILNKLPCDDWNNISLTMTDIVDKNFSAKKMSEKYQEMYRRL